MTAGNVSSLLMTWEDSKTKMPGNGTSDLEYLAKVMAGLDAAQCFVSWSSGSPLRSRNLPRRRSGFPTNFGEMGVFYLQPADPS